MAAWNPEKVAAFRESFYDFLNYVPISSKEKGQMILGENLYRAQHIFYETIFEGLSADIHDFYILKSRQLGMCLDPSMRVLTADLRWVPIGEIEVGTEVVAVDEDSPPKGSGERKMRTAIIEAKYVKRQWAYEIELDDGRRLICSDLHRWLSRNSGDTTTKWRALRPARKRGRRTRFKLSIGSQLRWITKPWDDPTVEDGWFGGMLDGEGSRSNEGRSGASINAADRGYTGLVENDESKRLTKYGKEPVPKLCFNRMDEIFRLLGTTRPTRFAGWRFWENRSLPGKNSGIGWATITNIRLLGERDLVDVQTSTGTFVAEGIVSHNSTSTRGLSIFWLGIHDGLRGAMVFDTAFNTASARREIEETIDNLPKKVRFPRIKSRNRDVLVLENDSWLLFMQAGTKNSRAGGGLGRSLGLNFIHACMAPGTPVIVGDGKIKKIEHVDAGDYVVTHTGEYGRVIANVGQLNLSGNMRRIMPWLGEPITCTGDHKIPTQRGMLRAAELLPTDKLIMPKRRIFDVVSAIVLPTTPPRRQHGGRIAVGSGATIKLTEEFGFFIGYYLAEGHITLQPSRGNFVDTPKPAGILFARHRDEARYADRAIAAVADVTTGRRIQDKPGTLTTTEHVYGAALAQWVNDHFGRVDGKRIPDDVFTWGEAFCRGLIAGLLAGDGSKTESIVNRNPRQRTKVYKQKNPRPRRTERNGGTPINRMTLTTTRSSIATQLRDLAVSCGFGWASLRYFAAGPRHGRNCKEAWVVTWNGIGASLLRQLIGLDVVPNHKLHAAKYEVKDNSVLINIRKIVDVECPYMYDLSIDHLDHTFRTPSFSVSNSEISSWANEEGVISFRQSLAEEYPDRLYIWESTARGYELWYRLYNEAKDDPYTKRTVFIGWWAKDNQRFLRRSQEFGIYGADPPNKREAERIAAVEELYGWKVTQEQLAWYRWKTDPSREIAEDDPEDSITVQEQPWCEEDAWQQTGSTFFMADKLTESMLRIAKEPEPKKFRFWPGVDFVTCDMQPSRNKREIEFCMWEEPEPDSWYVVAGDPAFGHDEQNNHSCAQVLRCYADGIDQVAEYASGSIQPHQFSWLLWTLVGYYGGSRPNSQCMMILELNGPGEEVWRQYQLVPNIVRSYLRPQARERGLIDIFNCARNYIYTRSDSMNAGHSMHWKCLALDTPLPTSSGWTSIGDVSIGDELFDETGGVCRVTGVSDIKRGNECFKITFDDRETIVADAEHIWKTADGMLRTTAELRAGMHAIRVAKPLVLPDADLPIDPYVLGVWLGDGDSTSGIISGHRDDIFDMAAELRNAGIEIGAINPDGHGKNVYRASILNIRGKLQELGVLGDKHIPKIYLRGSVEQRLSLLQGLMDTDGTINAMARQCSFFTSSSRLAGQFGELIRSLGIKSKYLTKIPWYTYNEERRAGKLAYHFSFTCYPEMPVFRLPRKLAVQQARFQTKSQRGGPQYARSKRHKIVAIDPVGSVPVRCIQVDSPSHLFLAGRGMVPTHNTQQQVKVQIMEACRNYLHNGLFTPRSMALIEEMRTVVRDGDSIGSEGRNRDDRTFATALGIRAWDEKIRRQMIAGNRTREAERAKLSLSPEDRWSLFQRHNLQDFFRRKEAARGQQQLAAARNAWRGAVGSRDGRRW